MYNDFIQAFQIFMKYDRPGMVYADHDIVYAGPDPSTVSAEDIAALEKLGWFIEDEESFAHFC